MDNTQKSDSGGCANLWRGWIRMGRPLRADCHLVFYIKDKYSQDDYTPYNYSQNNNYQTACIIIVKRSDTKR